MTEDYKIDKHKLDLEEDQNIKCIHCKKEIIHVEDGVVEKLEVEMSSDLKYIRCAHCKKVIGEARQVDAFDKEGPGGDVTWH